MDRLKLHEAAGVAAKFQRAALAYLSYGNAEPMRLEAETLAEMLRELGLGAAESTDAGKVLPLPALRKPLAAGRHQSDTLRRRTGYSDAS